MAVFWGPANLDYDYYNASNQDIALVVSSADGYPQVTDGYPSYWGQTVSTSVVQAFEANLGKKTPFLAINWKMMENSVLNYWSTGPAPIQGAAQNVVNAGKQVVVTMGTWDTAHTQDYNLRPAAIAAGTWDSYFTTAFGQLKTWGHDVLIRLDWEMTGTWYPWCLGAVSSGGNSWTNTAADLQGMYLRIAQLRDQVGATNVSLAWVPNFGASAATLQSIWPGTRADGSAYWDWLGMDAYQAGYYASAGLGVAGTNIASLQQLARGGSGTGLPDTWGALLGLSGAAKLPLGFFECQMNLSSGNFNVSGANLFTRAQRASWWKDALETSVPALPNLGLILVYWWNTAQAYAMDLADTPYDGSNNAVFNLANADFAQFKASIGSPYYLDGAQYTLQPDSSTLRPYVLQSNVTDRYGKSISSTSALKAWWRGTEASGNLADSSGNSHTATAVGTPTYQVAGPIPSNPTQKGVSLPGSTSTYFNPGDSDDFSPTTFNTGLQPGFTVEVPFSVTTWPSSQAHLYSKGASGAYEHSTFIAGGASSPEVVVAMWTPSGGAVIWAAASLGTVDTSKPHLIQWTTDLSKVWIYFDNVCVINGQGMGAGLANTTSPLELGNRADNIGAFGGTLGDIQTYGRKLSAAELTEHYYTWMVAPTISSIATSNLTSSSVTVTWTTDEASSSEVEYWLIS